MKMRIHFRLLSLMASFAMLTATMAVAQEGPGHAVAHQNTVRIDGSMTIALAQLEVEPLDLSTSWYLGTWSTGIMDKGHIGVDDTGSGGNVPNNGLVVHSISESNPLVAFATSWMRQSEVVAPTFFVRNRLANLDARRSLEYLEPDLKGQNRVYCIGVRVTF